MKAAHQDPNTNAMVNGERELWVHVMFQAVKDLKAKPVTNRRAKGYGDVEMNRAGARLWFESDAYDFGTFAWVCDLIGVRKDDVRRPIIDINVPKQLSRRR